MDKDITVVRVYLTEAEHGARRRNLLEELVGVLHDEHKVRGVTVFRGIAGFGSRGQVHSADLLRLSADLPVVIEFFDAPAVAAEAIRSIESRVAAGHIIHWPASCVDR